MKTKQITTFAALVLSPCLLMADGATTNTALDGVEVALRPILARLTPEPTVEYPKHNPSSLCVTFLPLTHKVHGTSLAGEVSTNVFDTVGPSLWGFVLRIELQPKGEVNQPCTPQTIRQPCWMTELDVTPIGQTDQQIFWALSYAGHTPTSVLAEIKAVLRQLGKGPNQAAQTCSVKDGENLFDVAIRWGVSPSDLMRLNSLTSAVLRAGTVLNIPGPPDEGKHVGVVAPDKIIRSDATASYEKRVLKTAHFYPVKEGEDLYVVALRWGVSPSDLKTLNSLTSAVLRAGTVLKIPGAL